MKAMLVGYIKGKRDIYEKGGSQEPNGVSTFRYFFA